MELELTGRVCDPPRQETETRTLCCAGFHHEQQFLLDSVAEKDNFLNLISNMLFLQLVDGCAMLGTEIFCYLSSVHFHSSRMFYFHGMKQRKAC